MYITWKLIEQYIIWSWCVQTWVVHFAVWISLICSVPITNRFKGKKLVFFLVALAGAVRIDLGGSPFTSCIDHNELFMSEFATQ